MKKHLKTALAIIISIIIIVLGNIGNSSDEIIINDTEINYTFRSDEQYQSHYEKHVDEFGDITIEEYLLMANNLINDDSGLVLTKLEKEDNDTIYYKEDTNEFLVLSTDGYIRTYFRPSDGIDYFNRQ